MAPVDEELMEIDEDILKTIELELLHSTGIHLLHLQELEINSRPP